MCCFENTGSSWHDPYSRTEEIKALAVGGRLDRVAFFIFWCVTPVKTTPRKTKKRKPLSTYCSSLLVFWLTVTMTDQNNIDDMVKQLTNQKGVLGVVVSDSSGVPIRTTVTAETSTRYAAMAAELSKKARSLLRGVDPEDDLLCLRLRSSKNIEYILAPDFMKEQGLSLLAVQKPDTT